MQEKLNLIQFQQYKNRLIDMMESIGNEIDEYEEKNGNITDEQIYERLTPYLELEKELLSYDLSDIPFDTWEDISLVGDNLDLSNSHANLDFSLIDFVEGSGNFKGCNVKGLLGIDPIDLNRCQFDDKVIQDNPQIFLSDNFDDDFKNKYYNKTLVLEDMIDLSPSQLEELEKKEVLSRYFNENYKVKGGIDTLGIRRAIEMCKNSRREFDLVSEMLSRIESNLRFDFPDEQEEFFEHLKDLEASDVKDYCFDVAEKQIVDSKYMDFSEDDFPLEFVQAKPKLFLTDSDIPEEVKKRYFERDLTIHDLVNYSEVFQNIPIDNFMSFSPLVTFFQDNYGIGKFQELVKNYPEVFLHIEEDNRNYEFSRRLVKTKDSDSSFRRAVKNYYMDYDFDEKTVETNSDWIKSMNFEFVEKINTVEELLQYDDSMIVIQNNQRRFIDTLGIDNIKKIEQELGLFSHGSEEMLEAFSFYFNSNRAYDLLKEGIDFKDGLLPYDEFLDQMAKCLDYMRGHNIFTDFPDYDWIQGEFRDNHPEIFMDQDAPEYLKKAFYKNKITPEYLFYHNHDLQYLVDKNLSNTIRTDTKLVVPVATDDKGMILPNSVDFVKEYVSRYGNEKLLQLFAKYGDIISDVSIMSLHDEIENEQAIERSLRESIYNKIISSYRYDYSYLENVSELVAEHPEIFVNFDSLTSISPKEREGLTWRFYNRKLDFDHIRKYPELINILKDKNLFLAFGGKYTYGNRLIGYNYDEDNSPLMLLKAFGNEKFLELCFKYGDYLDGVSEYLKDDVNSMIDGDTLSIKKISKRIEELITREVKLGKLSYDEFAPSFLKQNNPELFLNDDAPEELKNCFYKGGMSFTVLHDHKEWMSFLKGKSIKTSLLMAVDPRTQEELMKYFELFGDEKGIKLGINRTETVERMLSSRQTQLMKDWYDKTGGKFIPDFVVMKNFPFEEADKFLVSGSNWSQLMRIKSFSNTPESRDAMLKLAYSFGAFDQDQRGFKKLKDLLTDLPRKITADQGYIIDRIDSQIDQFSQRGVFYGNKTVIDVNGDKRIESPNMTPEEKEEAYNKMIEYVEGSNFIDLIDTTTLVNLLKTFKEEKVDIDFSKPIFAQLYKKNNDGTYSLTINPQSCQKSAQVVRSVLEKFRELPILTPEKAHQLFGGFELKYDPDFREFLLANMDEVFENPEYISLVSGIQRQFADIKTLNSNRKLTWDLAVSYVQTNKFVSVDIGNERVAEISARAGYSQYDFDILQQIYNYGKQRTFSSIPRIEQSVEKTSGNYTYETLKLDDPLAMAIGTLTDCCQELNNCAEVCMEHSMVDKNGRVFVIKDEEGKIVAQSWVWRNKDVLCFDNIEIPDKAFIRVGTEHPELGRKGFTDEIFEIYKQAAHDLVEADEEVYKKLLESGKITEEQYEGLKLGKITVGLGYNDIAASLKQNAELDKGTISRPLPFDEPVKLTQSLYTNDSTTQYVLEEREDRKEYDGETLPVHNDSYVEYTDADFTMNSLLSLEKLEMITKDYPNYLKTSVADYVDHDYLVSEIASNYELNPETTKIIMHPNFAIIYDTKGDQVKIGDLLFNTEVNDGERQMNIEDKVAMQIRLALDQIANDKEVDVSDLDEKQMEMYDKAIGLTDEMDIERGVGNAR